MSLVYPGTLRWPDWQDPGTVADINLQAVELHIHSLRQILQRDVPREPRRVRDVTLPHGVLHGVKFEPHDNPRGIVHHFVLRRQLHIQPNSHANEERTHAQQLSGLRHVDDL